MTTMHSLQHRASLCFAATALAALSGSCRSSGDQADAAPVDAGIDAPPPRAPAAVEPGVKRYPDEVPLNGAHGQAVVACAALSSAMDPGMWVVETLPLGWKLVEVARHGDFMLVQWKPTGRGAHLSGWIRADAVGREADVPAVDAGTCADASAPYGNLPCARQCWADGDCAKPSSCIRTEPGEKLNDVSGLCIAPDGRAVQ
jgi:hypothetical protein